VKDLNTTFEQILRFAQDDVKRQILRFVATRLITPPLSIGRGGRGVSQADPSDLKDGPQDDVERIMSS